MNLRSVLRRLAVALGLFIVAGLFGYDAGTAKERKRGADALQLAQVQAALADAQVALYQGTLRDIAQRLAAIRGELERKNAIAATELAKREQLQQQLDHQAQARTQSITKVGHEDPDCTDLATLPVCPAIAERLWGEAYGPQVPPAAGTSHR